MAQTAQKDFDPTTDSWAPGEPVPKGMPAADTTGAGSTGSESLESITKGLADIKSREMAATNGAANAVVGGANRDLAQVQQAYKTEGIKAEDIKPWDAEAESKKHTTDPVEAFGSLGSVFGILASAFTHQPFYTALGASAAAMNAIKEGDDKAYDRAHKAWEENTKLALDRHKIQHEHYQDAIELLKTNMAAGEAKMKVLAARFGDEKTLFLLEHGMNKEVIDLQASREKLALGLQEKLPKIMMANAEMSRLISPREDPDNPGHTIKYDPKHPDTPESSKAVLLWQKEQAEIKRTSHSIVGGGILTPGRQQATAIQERAQQLQEQAQKEGKSLSPDQAYVQATREIKLATATPTGNRLDDNRAQADRVQNAIDVIDQVDKLLLEHKFITGIGGALTRPPEIVANMLGSNETDREQFKRYIEQLRLVMPRLLLATKGRPVAAEAERVNTIVAGISPGDTGPNTIRAYVELRKQLNHIKQQLQDRQGGTAAPETRAAPKAEKGWDAYPTVGGSSGKRSELEDDRIPSNARPTEYTAPQSQPHELPQEGTLPGALHLNPKIAPKVADGAPRPFAPGEWLQNPNGSWSSEITATVQNRDGSWSVVPTLWLVNGKPQRVDEDTAARYAERSGLHFRRFSSESQAEKFSEQRENSWQDLEPSQASKIPPLWKRH